MMHVCRLFYLQVVKIAIVVVLHIKKVEEEGDVAVLWRHQDDDTVHGIWVDVGPAGTLQVAVFLFIGSATVWKPPPTQSEHVPSVPIMLSVSKPIVHFSWVLFHREKESMKTASVFCDQRHRDSVSEKRCWICISKPGKKDFSVIWATQPFKMASLSQWSCADWWDGVNMSSIGSHLLVHMGQSSHRLMNTLFPKPNLYSTTDTYWRSDTWNSGHFLSWRRQTWSPWGWFCRSCRSPVDDYPMHRTCVTAHSLPGNTRITSFRYITIL